MQRLQLLVVVVNLRVASRVVIASILPVGAPMLGASISIIANRVMVQGMVSQIVVIARLQSKSLVDLRGQVVNEVQVVLFLFP